MVSAGPYLLGALQLLAVGLSFAWTAYRLRAATLPGWRGAPARLVETVVWFSLLVVAAELLGVVGLLYPGALIAAALLAAAAATLLPARGAPARGATGEGHPSSDRRLSAALSLAMVAAIGIVVAQWAVTAKHALDAGIFNFDSLWYHMPFAVDIAQSHSVTGLHYVDTVFTNWLYPQNSELLHALGVVLTGRDTLSLFLNFAWLGLAFLAAWCIGRPYGRGQLSVIAVSVLLGSHTLVVREPGAAKNDIVAAALLLAAVAILVELHSRRTRDGVGEPPGWRWALAAAGLAVGLAVGTKSTALAMAAALTVAAVALVPAGRRWTALGWWTAAGLATAGYWYARNLVVAGNPIPQIDALGPISLPHPERLQTGRPDFSVAHYATDTAVWREYFGPGLENAFGSLWPLLIAACLAGAVMALALARERPAVRWAGAVALFGMLAYLFTPLSAAGAEGAPTGFGINIRYAVPALLVGIALLPLAPVFRGRAAQWALLAFLAVLVLVGNRPDEVLRDHARVFAVLFAAALVLVLAALLVARDRGAGRAVLAAGCAGLLVAAVAAGYPLQRHYLEGRFANPDPAEGIPGMGLDAAYRWARDLRGADVGLVGTTAGFANYGFYGTELTNRVVYLGERGPHAAFNAIPTCRAFRAAVNDAELDYLVTAPFLNFIHVDEPIDSPEARWLRGDPAAVPVLRGREATVWRLRGELDPEGCGPANAPLREVPRTPAS